jgi:hypothetical protein
VQKTTRNGAKNDAKGRNGCTRTCNEPGINRERQPARARDEPVASNSKVPAKRPGRPAVAASVEPPGFRDFWTVYPRKVARGEALKSYARAVNRDGPDVIAAGLTGWVAHWRAEGTDQQFIPHPTTWLNQNRYFDAPPARRMGQTERELRSFLERHRDDPQ